MNLKALEQRISALDARSVARSVVTVDARYGEDSAPAYDACDDSNTRLRNPAATDNTYVGDERYWDAVSTCE